MKRAEVLRARPTVATGAALLLTLGACALERPVAAMCAPAADAMAFLPAAVMQETMEETTRSMVQTLRARVEEAPSAPRTAPAPPVVVNVLSLSAGGQFGAFGAGFLRGWSENPSTPRPEFDLVTGVSAGGMLAPVAFAGQRFDPVLDGYRGLAESDVYRRRPILTLASAPSIATPAPLEALLEAQLSDPLIDAIAERHRDGAGLFVSAVNLDTTAIEVFDLGALAAEEASLPRRRGCLTEVMLASAAIPGLFPPRNIGGALYVDGGLRDQVFLRAVESARAQVARETGRSLRIEAVVVVNGSLRAPGVPVEDRLPAYVERSVVALADEVLRDSIAETLDFAAGRPGWRVRGIVAGTDLSACGSEIPSGTFDPCVTERLFDGGRAAGRAVPIDWLEADALRALAAEF